MAECGWGSPAVGLEWLGEAGVGVHDGSSGGGLTALVVALMWQSQGQGFRSQESPPYCYRWENLGWRVWENKARWVERIC